MPRPNALAGTTLGKYKVLRKIGRGGMAHVYLAEDTTLQRKVALKVLDAARSADEHFVKRFQREARTAAALKHPNIVTIYEVGEIEEVYFIAMEYLTGRPLKDILVAAQEKGQLLNMDYAFNVIEQVADALTYAYETAKIVHRDVKPANIMVDDEGHVTLTDFGIARALEEESDLTSDSGFIGTPMYMSPEHIEGGTIDHRSDVYSLGVVVYQILVGGGPFGQTTTSGQIMYKHVHAQPVSPRKLNKRVNSRVEQVVLKALAKKPGKRYQTARAFAEALQKAQASRLPVIPKWIAPTLVGLIVVSGLGLFFPQMIRDQVQSRANRLSQNQVSVSNNVQSTIILNGEFPLKKGPGDSYSDLGTLPSGTKIIAVAQNADGSWLKVSTEDGSAGWINMPDVSGGQLPVINIALIQPSPTPTPTPTKTPTVTPTFTPIVVVAPTLTPTSTPAYPVARDYNNVLQVDRFKQENWPEIESRNGKKNLCNGIASATEKYFSPKTPLSLQSSGMVELKLSGRLSGWDTYGVKLKTNKGNLIVTVNNAVGDIYLVSVTTDPISSFRYDKIEKGSSFTEHSSSFRLQMVFEGDHFAIWINGKPLRDDTSKDVLTFQSPIFSTPKTEIGLIVGRGTCIEPERITIFGK